MIRRLALCAFLGLSLLLPSAPASSIAAASHHRIETKDCVVYITRTGHRYHRAGCRYLRQSSIATTRAKAIARRLTPCSVCGGSDCEPE